MKQISTGAGLLGLSVGMVATAFVATHRNGSEAFAQVTGGERRVVFANINSVQEANAYYGSGTAHYAFRIWSDNSTDMRLLGITYNGNGPGNRQWAFGQTWGPAAFNGWETVDNGTSGFRPLTDVDMSGETDAGDISQVLLDFNTRSEDLPPPPIDCNINAPR